MSITPEETAQLQADLPQFTGSEQYHRWSIFFRRYLLTDGAHYLAEKAGAFWLMDAIASYYPQLKHEPFQVWRLKVDDNASAVLTADDGNGKVICQQKVEWTDFPLKEIKLYCSQNDDVNWVIMLPDEY